MKPLPTATSKSNAFVVLRCVLFWGAFLLLLFAFAPFTPLFPPSWSRFAYGVFGTLSALFLTWLFLKGEKRTFREVGLVWENGTGLRFFKGLLLGSALFGLVLLVLVSLTPLSLQPNPKPFAATAFVGYLAFLPLSLMEEVAFRSYTFLRLHQRFGLRTTQVIVAAAFALYHVAGGQSVAGSFLGPGVYAFVFGLAAIWSGGIALPLGIHVALNILQPLTGMRGDTGSVWVLKSGDNFGNNSLAAPDTIGLAMQLIVLATALLLTEYYVRKKGNKLPEATAAKGSTLYPGNLP